MILKLLIIALATVGNKVAYGTAISSCVVLPSVPNQTDPSLHTAAASFTNVGSKIFGISDVKQCEVRTSPNCLFPQWDPKLHKWDDGGFCMEETLTGGACVGDIDGNGFDDIYYDAKDGTDRLFLNAGDGNFFDGTASAGLDRPLVIYSLIMMAPSYMS